MRPPRPPEPIQPDSSPTSTDPSPSTRSSVPPSCCWRSSDDSTPTRRAASSYSPAQRTSCRCQLSPTPSPGGLSTSRCGRSHRARCTMSASSSSTVSSLGGSRGSLGFGSAGERSPPHHRNRGQGERHALYHRLHGPALPARQARPPLQGRRRPAHRRRHTAVRRSTGRRAGQRALGLAWG